VNRLLDLTLTGPLVAKPLIAQRQAFVEQLAGHSDSGRLHDQEAILNNRMKSPETLLTLPEFIRESVPPELVKADPHAVFTLPEFMKESVPPGIGPPTAVMNKRSLKGLRNRSLSAPSLDWIFSSGTKTPPERKAHKRTKSPSQSISGTGMALTCNFLPHFFLSTISSRFTWA